MGTLDYRTFAWEPLTRRVASPFPLTTGEGPGIRVRKLYQAKVLINKDKRILRAPDVGFLANANLPDSNIGAVPVPPDLAVEIMLPHDYDCRSEFREKIRQYQEAGVPLVWVVSPREKTVEVYRPTFAAPVAELHESDSVSGE